MDEQTETPALTLAQRRALADLAVSQLGTLMEFFSEFSQDTDAEGIDAGAAREWLATWASRIPSEHWHVALGEVPRRR